MGIGVMFRAFSVRSAQQLVSDSSLSPLLAPHVRAGLAAFPCIWGANAPNTQIDGSIEGAERVLRMKRAGMFLQSGKPSNLPQGQARSQAMPGLPQSDKDLMQAKNTKKIAQEAGRQMMRLLRSGKSDTAEIQSDQWKLGLSQLATWAAARVAGVSTPLQHFLVPLAALQACMETNATESEMNHVLKETNSASGQLYRASETLARAAAATRAAMGGSASMGSGGVQEATVMPFPSVPGGIHSSGGIGSASPECETRIFVTLVRGSFAQDTHRNPRNVQVRVRLLKTNGRGIACLSRGINGPSDAGSMHAGAGALGSET